MLIRGVIAALALYGIVAAIGVGILNTWQMLHSGVTAGGIAAVVAAVIGGALALAALQSLGGRAGW